MKRECGRITKKQYLGDHSLTEYVIEPGTIWVEDWAFAYCSHLERIAFPETVAGIGKALFLGCVALNTVYFYDSRAQSGRFLFEEAEKEQRLEGELYALAFRYFNDADALIRAHYGRDKKLIETWEVLFDKFLSTPEEDGFEPFLAGGEEDYEGAEEAALSYCHGMRLKKTEAILQRMLWGKLSGEGETKAYLHYQKKLQEAQEAYEVLGNVEQFYQQAIDIYEEAGFLDSVHIEKLLEAVSPQKAELRGMIIKRAQGNLFDRFVL